MFSGAQLKTIQEIITLCVFAVFSWAYLNEPLRWNHLAAFACSSARPSSCFFDEEVVHKSLPG